MERRTLATAGLVVVKDRKLLLAFSSRKRAYYLPGGKIDPGESPREALIREAKEELHLFLHPDQLQYYTHVTAQAYGEDQGVIMEQDCFMHELNEPLAPDAEIESVKYFDEAGYRLEPAQVPGVITILHQLKQDLLID